MARTDASARRRAALASIDPAYLAYPLARYQRAQQRTDRALAAELGITVGQLDQFRLCRWPAIDRYAIRLYGLVEAFGVDVRAMARVLATEGAMA